MCEINPKHTKILRLEFFTSAPNMTKEEFEAIVMQTAFAMEQMANRDMRIRCHIHDSPQPNANVDLPGYTVYTDPPT